MDYDEVRDSIGALAKAEERLAGITPVGGDLVRDLFLSLLRARPKLLDREDVRATHHVAHQALAEAMDLPDWHRLHAETKGDPWFAGMATAGISRLLEPILQRLSEQQDQADQLDQTMQDLADLEQQMADLDGTDVGDGGVDPDALQAQVDALLAAAKDQADQLDASMTISALDVSAAMQSAIVQAADRVADTKDLMALWGTDPGQLQRMDAEAHLKLASQLDSNFLRELSKLIGAMRYDVVAARSSKSHYTPTEVFSIERGNNLGRLLPSEKAKLMDPVRQLEFVKGYVNRSLLQYKLRSEKKIGAGAIICAIDTSLSMKGQRFLWAKATAHHLLQIARDEDRAFVGIVFSGPGAFHLHHFATKADFTTERMIAWAEDSIAGGTCFETPMNEAVKILDAEFAKDGKTSGDIILLSDNECSVSQEWFDWYKGERKRLEFDCYAVAIGGSVADQYGIGANALSDGKVSVVGDLFTAKDTKSVFAAL